VDGTQLVSQFHKTNPRLINIIVTGYPVLENAINALNEGAQGYVVKPVDLEKLLGFIEQKLEKRIQSEVITEDKMVDWVKQRVEHLSGLETKES
jgi:DNA-binding NtrC family response regulator